MEQVARLLAGIAGVGLIVAGTVGIVAVAIGRPIWRGVAALEMLFWFAVLIAVGGLLILVAARL
jgi:hypothetical protein